MVADRCQATVTRSMAAKTIATSGGAIHRSPAHWGAVALEVGGVNVSAGRAAACVNHERQCLKNDAAGKMLVMNHGFFLSWYFRSPLLWGPSR